MEHENPKWHPRKRRKNDKNCETTGIGKRRKDPKLGQLENEKKEGKKTNREKKREIRRNHQQRQLKSSTQKHRKHL